MAHTILIVEDDGDLRRMFRTALTIEGFHVLEAENGFAALMLLDRVPPPDLILLDLRLPLVSGEAVKQELSAQAHLREVPVVVVTAAPGLHDALQAKCVLRKPVGLEELIRVVRSCLTSDAKGAT